MENASKALLIAGGVLIAMIIASFGVYLYGVYHSHSENMLAVMSQKEIDEFNAKFLTFEGKDLTANEVVSIMNLVRENNYRKKGTEYQIKVNTDGWQKASEIIDNKGETDINKLIMEPDEKKYSEICNSMLFKAQELGRYKFKCSGFKYNENTHLINVLYITNSPL